MATKERLQKKLIVNMVEKHINELKNQNKNPADILNDLLDLKLDLKSKNVSVNDLKPVQNAIDSYIPLFYSSEKTNTAKDNLIVLMRLLQSLKNENKPNEKEKIKKKYNTIKILL